MSRGNLSDVDLMHLASMRTSGFVVLDIEATGSDPRKDQVIAVAVVDDDGEVLFDHLIKPADRSRWPEAKQIRGIQWSDVEGEKELSSYSGELKRILESAPLVVGYDLDTALTMLEACGLKLQLNDSLDLMKEYTKAHGRWSERSKDYSFATLVDLSRRYGYSGRPITALSDAEATAYVYKAFIGECRKELGVNDGKEQVEDAPASAEGDSNTNRRNTIMGFTIAILIFVLCYFLARAIV